MLQTKRLQTNRLQTKRLQTKRLQTKKVGQHSMDIQRWDRAKEKVGNVFELTVLIQKRVRELVKERQRPLVDFTHRNPIQIALEEVLQDKIYLAPPPPPPSEVQSEPGPAPAAAAAPAPAASADPTAAPKAEAAVLDDEDLG